MIAGIFSKPHPFEDGAFSLKSIFDSRLDVSAGSEGHLRHQIGCWLQPTTMRRTPVRSTSIASIGYLPSERELEIKFRVSGDVYRYFDVLVEEYVAFMAAESKGTYLNQVFKPREHRYVVVSEGKKSPV